MHSLEFYALFLFVKFCPSYIAPPSTSIIFVILLLSVFYREPCFGTTKLA